MRRQDSAQASPGHLQLPDSESVGQARLGREEGTLAVPLHFRGLSWKVGTSDLIVPYILWLFEFTVSA